MKTLANLFLFKLIIIALLFTSCSDDLEATYRLSSEEKEYIPFSGGEKILYLTIDNLSFELIAEPLNVEFEEGSYDNTDRYYLYETCKTHLDCTNLKIRYILNSNDKKYGDKPYLTIEWSSDFTSDHIYVAGGARVPMDTSDRFADIVELDSLKVSDKVYYEVFKGNMYRSTNDTATLSMTYPVYYYYALHSGVIRFDFSRQHKLGA